MSVCVREEETGGLGNMRERGVTMEHGELIQVHDDRREAVDVLSEAPKRPNMRHPVHCTDDQQQLMQHIARSRNTPHAPVVARVRVARHEHWCHGRIENMPRRALERIERTAARR